MIDWHDLSYQHNNSLGKVTIKSLTDEGFKQYLSKDSYARSFLTHKFPYLKENFIKTDVDKISKINENKDIGIFSTQIKINEKENIQPSRINYPLQEEEDKIQNLKTHNLKLDIPKSKSHTLLYSRDLLKNDKFKKVLDLYEKSKENKRKNNNFLSNFQSNKFKQLHTKNIPVLPGFKELKLTKQITSFSTIKQTVNSNSDYNNNYPKKAFIGFKSFNVPRITTQMKKSKSDQLPNNVVTKYYKTMEISLKAGEKLFNNIDFSRKERYNNIRGICEKSDNKMQKIIQTQKNDSIYHPRYIPKLKSLSIKNSKISVRVAGGGSGKHMGYNYNPHDYYYPIHQMKDRNKFGQKFIY